MSVFAPTLPKPPILDTSVRLDLPPQVSAEAQGESVPRLRALRDAVQRDLSVLDKFLADPQCAALPPLSTNAPYLVAVWNEVLCAPAPVTAIWQTFPDPAQVQGKATRKRGSQKPPGVKVDVVADGGRRWIRVNTIKNSRLLAEFRELDSYLTSSEEESLDEGSPSSSGSTPRSSSPRSRRVPPLDNSLLGSARTLLDTASAHPHPGTHVPQVTLRLTRLDPTCGDDARIPQTIAALREMGLEVQLGERAPGEVSTAHMSNAGETKETEPIPTQKVNLDLSLLLALVSDIAHAHLPRDEVEAKARYMPPKGGAYWKWKMGSREEEHDGDAVDSDTDQTDESWQEHSRALGQQTMQEMRRGLLQDMYERLVQLYPPTAAALSSPSSNQADAADGFLRPHVEFYTTPAARMRFLQIVLSKIGGPAEQRRARALFCLPDDYSPEPLSSSDTPPDDAPTQPQDGSSQTNGTLTPYATQTIHARIAEEAYWSGSRHPPGLLPLIPIRVFPSIESLASVPSLTHSLAALEISSTSSSDPVPQTSSPFCRELAQTCRSILATHDAPASAPRPPRLTRHTAESLLAGAARGWTTMTANRASVRAVLRGVRALAEDGGLVTYLDEQVTVDDERDWSYENRARQARAALWVVDPRSLAEGMRADSLDRVS
ncbi:hypothetical protein CERSUDRAFT_95271 [Gelatoporia subvermispora B]|uniref:DUF1308 domain-containing protein n=1 Tax=Ceriporiopsis subvermispora (strain B) TaxID=914234 RepID=M2QXY0_CERS8|nr:hypothetical protein CERSUDRAFT_95271 [Gelatoporia subvermispora B]